MINQVISREIVDAVKKTQKQISIGSNLSNVTDQTGLRELLIMKADKSDFERLYELKTNKIDTEHVMNSVSTLSRQLKNLVVLFMESLRIRI